MSQKTNIEIEHYRRRMLEDAEEWKTFIKIDAKLIRDTPNNSELGSLVRKLMNEKIEQSDEHIKQVKQR
jgi:hypothetical protein